MYQRILNGDETPIQELWDYLFKFSVNHWDNKTVDFFRQDYVNEAVWKILNNLESYRGQAKFTTWATSIFINFGLAKSENNAIKQATMIWNMMELFKLTTMRF